MEKYSEAIQNLTEFVTKINTSKTDDDECELIEQLIEGESKDAPAIF